MKCIIIFILFALTVSITAAYQLPQTNEVHTIDDWKRKHLLKQNERLKKIDTIETHTPRRLSDDKLDHSRLVKTFKVNKDYTASMKKGVSVPKWNSFNEPNWPAFKFDAKRKEIKLKKSSHEKSFMKPTYNIQPAKKDQKSIPYKHKKMEESHENLHNINSYLPTKNVKPEFQQIEKHTNHLYSGNNLMETGFNRMDSKHLDKPFFGVYGEYDELQGDLDYLKNKERSISKKEHFPKTKQVFKSRSNEVAMGNKMMDRGYKQIDSVDIKSRYNNLKGELNHLDVSSNKLDKYNDNTKGINFDGGLKDLETESDAVFSSKGFVDTPFGALQEHDLEGKYEDLQSNIGGFSHGKSSKMSEYGDDHITGGDFKKGFGFINTHANKFGGANMLGGGGGGMMNFPGFG